MRRCGRDFFWTSRFLLPRFASAFDSRRKNHAQKTELNKQLIMGKRKSRAKPPPKKKMNKVDTAFCCPFCNHGSSVECSIDLKNLIGEASCFVCLESFSTTIHALTESIDIYSEWIDECELVNNREGDT